MECQKRAKKYRAMIGKFCFWSASLHDSSRAFIYWGICFFKLKTRASKMRDTGGVQVLISALGSGLQRETADARSVVVAHAMVAPSAVSVGNGVPTAGRARRDSTLAQKRKGGKREEQTTWRLYGKTPDPWTHSAKTHGGSTRYYPSLLCHVCLPTTKSARPTALLRARPFLFFGGRSFARHSTAIDLTLVCGLLLKWARYCGKQIWMLGGLGNEHVMLTME